MNQYTISQWIIFFYIYCFLGWCVECTYVSVHQKHFVNRGFMRGPWLPIYGSGAITLLFLAIPFIKYPLLVFVSGFFGASVLEYVTGSVMESLFKVRYWDYSKKKFNINGQVCLLNSTYWGLLSLVMNYGFHRIIDKLVLIIPIHTLNLFVGILSVVVFSDFALSFKAAMDMREVLIRLEKAKEELYRVQKRMDVLIAVASDEVMEELDELKLKAEIIKDRLITVSNTRDRIIKALMAGNPSMTSRMFKESFETLKTSIMNRAGKHEDNDEF